MSTEPLLPVLGCRPVTLTEAEVRLSMALLPVYEGSIERTCVACDRPVYVGPKQQEMLDVALVLCIPCVLNGVQMSGKLPTIHNLGNRTADHRN